jgi:hypothetical protein
MSFENSSLSLAMLMTAWMAVTVVNEAATKAAVSPRSRFARRRQSRACHKLRWEFLHAKVRGPFFEDALSGKLDEFPLPL